MDLQMQLERPIAKERERGRRKKGKDHALVKIALGKKWHRGRYRLTEGSHN